MAAGPIVAAGELVDMRASSRECILRAGKLLCLLIQEAGVQVVEVCRTGSIPYAVSNETLHASRNDLVEAISLSDQE